MSEAATRERSVDLGGATRPSGVIARYRGLSVRILATDGLSIAAAMALAFLIRFGIQPMPNDFVLLMAITPVGLIGTFSAFGLYSVHLLSPAEEFRRIIAAIATIIAGISLFGFWSHIPYSRLWLGMTWILAMLLCLASRKRWRRAMARGRLDGSLVYRTLVVGANQEARGVLEAFRSPTLGFRPIGIVVREHEGDVASGALDPDLARIPHAAVADVDGLRRVIRSLSVDCVFVASSAVRPEEVAQIVTASRLEGIEARLSLNVPQILPTRLTVQPLDGLTIVSLRSARLSGGQAAAKRAVDIVGSLAGLMIMLIPCICIAVVIKMTSQGPVLFRQIRVGRQGRRFTLFKFRTMVPGAEGMLIDLRDRNEADGPLFKIRDDPRMTTPGRWLRRWSLDELPQLLNVLRGDMSLVGPRPPLPEEVDLYEDWQRGRLEVAPGITGLWQIGGRIDLPFAEAVRRDIFYIENWSLSYDVFILAKTIPAILSRKGAC